MSKVVRLFLEMIDYVRVKIAPIAARYNVDLRARILSRSDDMTVRILDISESGCFASTDNRLEIGSLVGIDFKYHNLHVHAVAIVIRNTKNPLGSGFMFVAATRAERQAIRNLIRRLEQDSARSGDQQVA